MAERNGKRHHANRSDATSRSSMRRSACSSPSTADSAGQCADLGGYVNTLAFLARGYGLDTCPQVRWIRMREIVRMFARHPSRADAVLPHGHRLWRLPPPVNSFRMRRAETSEFGKFFGFDEPFSGLVRWASVRVGPTERRRLKDEAKQGVCWSERRDSNSRPPVPQTGALTGLRYAPKCGGL